MHFLLGKAFFGDMLALAGAWAAAGYMMVGRKLRTTLNLVPYIFIVYGIAAISLLILVALNREPLTGYSSVVYLWFILLALIPQILGHSTFNWALKYLPASSVSTILLGEPIGSTLLAVIIFKEIPGWIKVGGVTLILAGIWMVSRKGDSRNL